MPVVLRGITWDHPRGASSVRAASKEFTASHPDVEIHWSARSLAEFEDVPVRQLATSFDVLAIDHPFVGQAERDKCLVPLDQVLAPEIIRDRSAHSVGPSHASYEWNGHQWALAMDAAAQVSAYRADLFERVGAEPPPTWSEATRLITRLSDRYASIIPAAPTHLMSCLLTLCHAEAADAMTLEDQRPGWWPDSGLHEDVAVPALEQLHELLALVSPDSLRLNPIQALDLLGSTDRVAYVPLVFGYVNYACNGYTARRVSYTDVPANGSQRTGSLLGGVGIAVSAYSHHREVAAAFAAWVTSESCQRGPYFDRGGQPGHRSVWSDPDLDHTANGFFSRTMFTLDHACVRPRSVHYPAFQRRAGHLLHDLTVVGEPAKRIVEQLNMLWSAMRDACIAGRGGT